MNRLWGTLRRSFFTGVLVTVPVIVTLLALRFLFRTIDGFLGPIFDRILHRHIPGLGLAATLLVIFLAGLVAGNLVGRRLIALGEKTLRNLPLVGKIYNASKEIMEAVTLPERMAFQEVILVEYPRRGVYAYGFVTSHTVRIQPDGPETMLNVFMPTTPIPTTGYTIQVPEHEALRVNVSVEDALKVVVSGGLVSPASLSAKPSSSATGAAAAPPARAQGDAPPEAPAS